MAGLVPAIHVFHAVMSLKDVDARHKAGHDGGFAQRSTNVLSASLRAEGEAVQKPNAWGSWIASSLRSSQ
ncbi:hypothetical protein [Rhodopseudomonas sp. BR0G17]|uniref:hypothetical protein n=1 Tax=Rhodopseudomonas sp. BR0G17 TaxID=2269368 RepID=UPI0013E02527|nr:hypothetical protein [Rhodopseudomonas sp. BR0G17]